MKRVALPALGLALLGSTACVMPDQVSQMQKDLADVRQQLRQIQQEQTESTERLEQMETMRVADFDDDEQVTRADLADLELRIDESTRGSSIAEQRLSEIDRRLDGMTQEVRQVRQLVREGVQPPRPGPVEYDAAALDADGTPTTASGNDSRVPPGTPPTVVEDPVAVPDSQALYSTAYADFSKGNYSLAVSGFEEYHERFPESELADNALYWIGECHFSQGNFGEAVRAFDNLLEAYPASDRAAAGNLKKALAFREQNQIGQAIVQFRYVIVTFPQSDEAKVAQEQLTSLGASI
ncbi:MAG: tol-pal system protein YbgF [bacterium]|nr:tol-pal system protein YbgF [bacterium]